MFIGIAFLLNSLAFTFADQITQAEPPWLLIVTNGLFFTAILLACASALLRVEISPRPIAITTLCLVTWPIFLWYLLAQPSTIARIYALSFAYAITSGYTAWLLIRAKPRSIVDWLFVDLALLFGLVSVARPLATWSGSLGWNEGGPLTASDYWSSILGLTPMVAVLVALAFLVAFGAQMIADVQHEAYRDYLTGLLNRRGFDKQVQLELSNVRLGPEPPAVMIADIDNFKKINDTFGHAVGDQVIALVASVLSTIGNPDAVGRTGGEEFGLFFTGRSTRALIEVAAGIRTKLRASKLQDLPDGYPITISIGIHVKHSDETFTQMMSEADASLYRAKRQGKDRAVLSVTAFQGNGSSAAQTQHVLLNTDNPAV